MRQRKMRKQRASRAARRPCVKFISLCMLAVLCAAVIFQSETVRAALENEKSQETRSVHISDADVENSTLVIGSHLIYMQELNETLLELAQESANSFNQHQMYYKSELSQGQWYDVTDAASIEDITTAGTPVGKDVIEALEFTHHTKSDGVTYDLVKDAAVSAFDINKPYNLMEMPELEPLRMQLSTLKEKQDMETQTESDLAYIEMIEAFFLTDIRNETTNRLDDQLRALQGYQSVLTGNDAEEAMTDRVTKVMAQVDAARRVESFTNLEEELNLLQVHATGTETIEESEDRKKKKAIAEEAINSANSNKDGRDYDAAIEKLKAAYEETQLPELEEEIKDARVEKAVWQADNALEEFKKKVSGWRSERKELEGRDLDKELADVEDDIQELADKIGIKEEERDALGDSEEDEKKKEELQKEIDGLKEEKSERESAKSSVESDINRLKELNSMLEEDNLANTQAKELEGTLNDLNTLYTELKDSRLFNKIKDLGDTDVTELEEEEEKDYSFTVNAEVIEAISQSIENVQESLQKNQAKTLAEGTSVSSKAEYEYTNQLIDNAVAANHAACDTAVDNLNDLQNIMEGKVVKRERELALLDNSLVARGHREYVQKLEAGVSEEYQEAAASGSSRTVLANLLEQQKSDTDIARTEYQSMLSAKTMRMENAAGQEYLLGLIDDVPDLEEAVCQDAAASYQKITVSDHLAWLKQEYKKLVDEAAGGAGTGELGELNAKKDTAQDAMRDALDKNDLAEAERQNALLMAAQQDIDDKQAELAAVMNSSSSSESDKAKAAAELGEGNSAASLNGIAASAAEKIRDGSTDGLDSAMAAIEAVGELEPEAAQAALAEVKDAADEMLATDSENIDADALKDISDQADELSRSLADQSASAGGAMSRDELLAFLENLLGGSFSELSSEGQAGMVLAVEWYGEHTLDGTIANLAAEYARAMESGGNPYVYGKYKKEISEYVSVKAIGSVLSFRYIFDDTEQTVTLQKKKSYYQFVAGQTEYVMTEEQTGALKKPCGLQNTLYITEKDAGTLFSCEAEYIDRAELGIVVTSTLKTDAEEIYNALVEAQ